MKIYGKMIYIVDTYGWIENFRGTSQGKRFENLLDDKKNKFITMECSITELFGYCLRENHEFRQLYDIIKNRSIILPVLREYWIKAAKIKSEFRRKRKHFGLLDAILVAKKDELKCKIISGDPHFKGLKDIFYIGK